MSVCSEQDPLSSLLYCRVVHSLEERKPASLQHLKKTTSYYFFYFSSFVRVLLFETCKRSALLCDDMKQNWNISGCVGVGVCDWWWDVTLCCVVMCCVMIYKSEGVRVWIKMLRSSFHVLFINKNNKQDINKQHPTYITAYGYHHDRHMRRQFQHISLPYKS